MSMMVNPYVLAAGGVPSDVVIAVAVTTLPTSTGAFDITTTDLDGRTPKAVLLMATQHRSANDPSNTAAAMWTFAGYDGTNIWSCSSRTSDNVPSTDSRVVQSDTQFLMCRSTGTALAATTNAHAFITNGVRLTFDFLHAEAPVRLVAIFFAGDDVSAKTAKSNQIGASAIDVTAPGFEPDLVLFAGVNSGNANATGGNIFGMTFGAAVNDGSDTQRCIAQAEADNVAAGAPYATIRSDCALAQVNPSTGAIDYKGVIGSFDANGFTITPSASGGNDYIFYLALKLTGYQAKLWSFDSPTSTGNQADTTPGFEPNFMLNALTSLESYNADGPASDNSSGIAIGAATATAAWAGATYVDYGADPTAAKSLAKATALLGATAGDSSDIEATLSSFDANGLTLNYSDVAASAKKGFMLALGPA